MAWGLSPIEDMNAPDAPCDGFGLFDATIDKKRKRVSTLEAFLPKTLAHERKNLTICTKAVVTKIQFSGDQAGQRAERVLFQYADQRSPKVFSAKVKKEVVVSSGAVGSPQVLLLRLVFLLVMALRWKDSNEMQWSWTKRTFRRMWY
jgi:choline dehydrogenase-like flavoprotein